MRRDGCGRHRTELHGSKRFVSSRIQGNAVLVGSLSPTRGGSGRCAGRGAGRDRRRRLCRAVHGTGACPARRGFGGAGSAGAGVRRQHAQRRLGQRWRQYRQELHRAADRARHGAHQRAAVGRRRCVQPDRACHCRGKDRVLLAQGRALRWGLDAEALCEAGRNRGQPERCGTVRLLHGSARTPARGDRQRFLLRRDGGGTVCQPASGTLLQGPAGCFPPARCAGLRHGSGRAHHPDRAPDGAWRRRAGPCRLGTW